PSTRAAPTRAPTTERSSSPTTRASASGSCSRARTGSPTPRTSRTSSPDAWARSTSRSAPAGISSPQTTTGGRTPGSPTHRACRHPRTTSTKLSGVYDGPSLKLYVNGALVSSQPWSEQIRSSQTPLQIGGDAIYGQYFKRLIDEVRVYSSALTQAQVQADMNTPIAGGGG